MQLFHEFLKNMFKLQNEDKQMIIAFEAVIIFIVFMISFVMLMQIESRRTKDFKQEQGTPKMKVASTNTEALSKDMRKPFTTKQLPNTQSPEVGEEAEVSVLKAVSRLDLIHSKGYQSPMDSKYGLQKSLSSDSGRSNDVPNKSRNQVDILNSTSTKMDEKMAHFLSNASLYR